MQLRYGRRFFFIAFGVRFGGIHLHPLTQHCGREEAFPRHVDDQEADGNDECRDDTQKQKKFLGFTF